MAGHCRLNIRRNLRKFISTTAGTCLQLDRSSHQAHAFSKKSGMSPRATAFMAMPLRIQMSWYSGAHGSLTDELASGDRQVTAKELSSIRLLVTGATLGIYADLNR